MKKVLRWTGGIILSLTILSGIVMWGCRIANSIQDTRLFNFHTQTGDFYKAWSDSWFYHGEIFYYVTYLGLLVGIVGCFLLLAGLEDNKK